MRRPFLSRFCPASGTVITLTPSPFLTSCASGQPRQRAQDTRQAASRAPADARGARERHWLSEYCFSVLQLLGLASCAAIVLIGVPQGVQ
ncbi:hypothetical protein VTN96DRAFT_610 [Rasamsonia emersonii]